MTNKVEILPAVNKQPPGAVFSTAEALSKYDRWYNAVNKFGGAGDPMTNTYFSADYAISKQQLEILFRGDWVTRKGIEIPAKDATRKFIQFIHDDKKVIDLMNDEFERLNVRDKFEEAIILQRLYGGNAMIIGAFDGQTVDQPLGNVKRIDFFNNVDRFFAYPMTFYQDPEQQNFGQPELYQVQDLRIGGARVFVVHETRVIRFDGDYLPPTLRVRNFGWGAPIIENVHEALRNFGVATQSGSAVLQDFITKKLKIANLADLMSNDLGEEQLINRLRIMAQELAINNIAVYGDDEEFDKMGTPTTGLHELMDRNFEMVSAAWNIPKSRFFSNMTGKLGGDSSEADLRIHYDNIEAMQKNRLSSKMRVVIDKVSEPFGFAPGDIKFEWLPLWQLSELDDAKVRNEVADSDVKYIQAGVVTPEEVYMSRFAGDEIDVTGMTGNTESRIKFLKQMAKQPLASEIDEPEAGDDIDQDD